MKNTIHGFNQKELVELGLDNDDALILRWFVDFKDTGKMVSKIIENEKYYWVKYEGIITDLPILKLKTKDALYRRFKKMDKAGVIKHITHKENGTFSFYTLGENYINLITSNIHIGNKSDMSEINPMGTEINPYRGTEINPEQKINLLNNTNLLNNIPSSQVDEVWSLYPNKKGKVDAYKKIPLLISNYGFEEIKKCVERYALEVKGKDKKFMAYGSTFFSGRFEDYLDENYEPSNNEKGQEDAFAGMTFI